MGRGQGRCTQDGPHSLEERNAVFAAVSTPMVSCCVRPTSAHRDFSPPPLQDTRMLGRFMDWDYEAARKVRRTHVRSNVSQHEAVIPVNLGRLQQIDVPSTGGQRQLREAHARVRHPPQFRRARRLRRSGGHDRKGHDGSPGAAHARPGEALQSVCPSTAVAPDPAFPTIVEPLPCAGVNPPQRILAPGAVKIAGAETFQTFGRELAEEVEKARSSDAALRLWNVVSC